jgi:outer membrane biosynthesis protein TonB
VKTPIRMDWTISAVAHAGALLVGLLSFSAMPTNATPPESLAADIMSSTEFSQLTKGMRTAPKADVPKPLVEKVAEPKPTENPANKVVDKPEVVAAVDEPPKPVEAKPEPKPPLPQARPEPKQREAFARENEPKPDPIAEAIKRDLAKKPEPKQATPAPQKKADPPKQQPKFDAGNIQHRLALLDKRDPQRRAATGETLSPTPSLGLPTGNAAALSQNEIDALRARLRDCWTVPVGLAEARDLVVSVRILFNKDGSLSADPRLMNQGSHPAFQAAAESALRAVRRCAPYTFMPPAKYEGWKDIIVDFDPRDMFRG